MHENEGVVAAAQLFKVLGNESRLLLLQLLDAEPRSVGALTQASGLSQPLVSQHLRTLRMAGLVMFARTGKEAIYRVADAHVAHVVADALAHVQEQHPGPAGGRLREEEDDHEHH